MPFAMLWPTFALVLLIFVVWSVLFYQRFAHMRRNPPKDADLATSEAALRYFQPVETSANNLRNLFEMPVLYFALIPLLLMTHYGNHLQAILAWVFVALRVVHSFIHIGPKKVPARFMVYFASCVVLAAMWVGFFVDMIHAASLYHQAMNAMR